MKKNIVNIIRKFRSSIFAEYLPMFLVVIILFFVMSLIPNTDIKSADELISTQDYHCPEYYDTKEEYAADVSRFLNDFRGNNPDMTDAEILMERYFLVESHCGYPPIYSVGISLSESSYSTEIIELPPLIDRDADYYDILKEHYMEDVSKYGDLAVRFWEEGYSLSWIKEVDVDSDVEIEKIIGLCNLSGQHCPHKVIIIDGEKQIFEFSGGLAHTNISKVEGGDGFYVEWDADKHTEGRSLCCPSGYMKTRFVHENGTFVPIDEREILYTLITDEEVTLYGKLHSRMTYGRAVFENLAEDAEYKYYIVEPPDYTEDGADKYSPTIRNLTGNEQIKITGKISDYCWWNEADYSGCVPWIDADDIKISGFLDKSGE